MIKKIIMAILTISLFTACEQAQEQPHWYDVMPRASWSNYERVDTGQNWFEVYKLNNNTYAIYEPNQWQEVISYLLLGNDKALLVDTGMGIGDLKAVIDNLTTLPITVINTHTHYDHVGSNHQFNVIYGRNTDFTTTNAAGHPHSDFVSMDTGEPVNSVGIDTIWKNLPDGFSLDEYEGKTFKITKTVENGEIIDLGNRTIEVVFIPGHTPDSIALLDRENKYLLTGDSFYLAPIYVRDKEASFHDYFMSTQIMFGLHNRVEYLLPGHNETMQKSKYLNELRAATMSILNPQTKYELENGNRTYDFRDFSIIVKDPLDFGIEEND